MRHHKFSALAFAVTLCAAGAWAQTKPAVAVLSVDSPLYSSAVISDSRIDARLSAGEPLLLLSSQDKRITLDGMPTLWYQVKTSEEATGWIPGSRLSFSSTAFKRSAFQSEDQYAAYIIMAARPGEKVLAARSFEKIAKGDIGYYVSYHDGGLPLAIVWERNLAATPSDEHLPKNFPSALKPFVYYVQWPVIELAGDQKTVSLDSLALSIPVQFPTEDGFYTEEIDEGFPWYTPEEANYYSYAYDGDEYDDDEDGERYIDPDFVEGLESYGLIKVGSTVVLGRHDDVNGGANWADEMDEYVGQEAVVTSLPGADTQGFLVVKVDSNGYAWRVRNVALKGGGEAGSYGYQLGDSVIIGAHRYIDEDNNWADEMLEYVGRTAVITSLEGIDGGNCYIVHVDIDDGDWFWRVETMSPAQ